MIDKDKGEYENLLSRVKFDLSQVEEYITGLETDLKEAKMEASHLREIKRVLKNHLGYPQVN